MLQADGLGHFYARKIFMNISRDGANIPVGDRTWTEGCDYYNWMCKDQQDLSTGVKRFIRLAM